MTVGTGQLVQDDHGDARQPTRRELDAYRSMWHASLTAGIGSSIELRASPEEMWQVLTDTAAHCDWNPFITELHGDLEVGNRIDVRIAPPGGRAMSFHPTVTEVEPGRRLAWLGHLLLPGLFDGAHSFTLEPLSDGRRRLVQSETFGGVLVWFSGGLLHNTEAGFRAMNEALRRQVTERNPV